MTRQALPLPVTNTETNCFAPRAGVRIGEALALEVCVAWELSGGSLEDIGHGNCPNCFESPNGFRRIVSGRIVKKLVKAAVVPFGL